MDIKIDLNCLENESIKMDVKKLQKMVILFNSVEQGWSVKKRNNSYIFSKPHENKKEVLEDSYLLNFMKTNLDIKKIFS